MSYWRRIRLSKVRLRTAADDVQDSGRRMGNRIPAPGRVASASPKIQAYALQDEDMIPWMLTCFKAPADGRTYDVAAEMLKDLGVGKIDYDK